MVPDTQNVIEDYSIHSDMNSGTICKIFHDIEREGIQKSILYLFLFILTPGTHVINIFLLYFIWNIMKVRSFWGDHTQNKTQDKPTSA